MSYAIHIHELEKVYQIKDGKRKQQFTALHKLNLQIEQGKVLGLIGHNGAGKSTLLKILSRITYPTRGSVEIHGRLASLLEVGTGFHPELSGRENIFLNGAILGMQRKEIEARFDEIVDFSGVERFIDTPVKHYSSGMYVRLAFSVAAHLHSDILLVDEVLAVGDAEFQKKCLGKMNEATKTGQRTVVFVSHNLRAIRDLCDEVVWLEAGQIKQRGPAKEVVNAYMANMRQHARHTSLEARTDRSGAGLARFTALSWKSPNHNLLIGGEPAALEAHYHGTENSLSNLSLRLNIFTSDGAFLTSLSNQNSGFTIQRAKGSGMLVCELPKLPLLSGNYSLTINLYANDELQDRVVEALQFEVQEGDFFGSGQVKARITEGIETPQHWRVEKAKEA
jgi:lipopolysaccharide transport system ATP-binding protein